MTRDKFTCLMARVQLILSDLIISFMWVWSCGLTKILLYNYLAFGQPIGEIMEGSLYVLSIFFFSWLGNNCSGGSYNPFSVSVLSDAISGDNARYWFAVGVRVPTQAIGSTIAVKFIIWAFPEICHDAILNVDIFRGALVEGALTYLIVVISLEASENHNNNFFLETWISSVCELALHILGDDLTGGCMNSAYAMGWAYARSDHITMNHIFVYWLAPVKATFLGVWTFRLFIRPKELDRKVKIE